MAEIQDFSRKMDAVRNAKLVREAVERSVRRVERIAPHLSVAFATAAMAVVLSMPTDPRGVLKNVRRFAHENEMPSEVIAVVEEQLAPVIVSAAALPSAVPVPSEADLVASLVTSGSFRREAEALARLALEAFGDPSFADADLPKLADAFERASETPEFARAFLGQFAACDLAAANSTFQTREIAEIALIALPVVLRDIASRPASLAVGAEMAAEAADGLPEATTVERQNSVDPMEERRKAFMSWLRNFEDTIDAGALSSKNKLPGLRFGFKTQGTMTKFILDRFSSHFKVFKTETQDERLARVNLFNPRRVLCLHDDKLENRHGGNMARFISEFLEFETVSLAEGIMRIAAALRRTGTEKIGCSELAKCLEGIAKTTPASFIAS